MSKEDKPNYNGTKKKIFSTTKGERTATPSRGGDNLGGKKESGPIMPGRRFRDPRKSDARTNLKFVPPLKKRNSSWETEPSLPQKGLLLEASLKHPDMSSPGETFEMNVLRPSREKQ